MEKWFLELLPACNKELQDMDRLYFAGNSRGNSRRDIIVSVSKYSFKEKIRKELRKLGQVKYNDKNVMFLQDLAPETLQRRRRELKEYKERLREENIKYFGGFLFKLSIIYNGKLYVIINKAEIKNLFQELGIRLDTRFQQERGEEEETAAETSKNLNTVKKTKKIQKYNTKEPHEP